MQTPVAFFIFNRPDCTRLVFQRIREVRPPHLLVVADGPRMDRAGEAERCQVTRAIIDEVDWPCTVDRNFSENNQGCKLRVSGGLDWVFSLVAEAIILEDDCLPDPTFFPYCEELLDRYRTDERTLSIMGNNFLDESESGEASYRFSYVPHVWGWATWRRAWHCYDILMRAWPEVRRRGGLASLFGPHEDMTSAWTGIMDHMYSGQEDTWDFQWILTSFSQAGMHIIPRRNMISNLGFSADATHTQDSHSWQAHRAVYTADSPIKHPVSVQVDHDADYKTYCRTLAIDVQKASTLNRKNVSVRVLRWILRRFKRGIDR